MAEALESIPATTAIDRDWPCIQCGYNLRTLAREAKCPECGLPVVKSLDMPPLSHADAAWLNRVRIGLVAVILALLCQLVMEPWRVTLGLFGTWPFDYWYNFRCLFCPMLLLPAANLQRRPEKPGAPWPGRKLYQVVILHLLFGLPAITLYYVRWTNAQLVANLVEPFFQVAEIWLVIEITLVLRKRIPSQAMRGDGRVLRALFCGLLSVELIAELWWVVMVVIQRQWPASTLEAILAWTRNIAGICLAPLWLYLPVFLFRFQLHLRRATHGDLAL